MQLSTWRTASPAPERHYKTLTVTISAQSLHMHAQGFFFKVELLICMGGLTLSHLMYTSFIPSATGSRSLMPNFLSVTLTSGTTSQPEEEETVVNVTTEEEQQDTTDLLILLKLQLLWYLKGLYN